MSCWHILIGNRKLFCYVMTSLDCFTLSLHNPWLRHKMETFSALLALCAGNSPVTGEFPHTKASDAELWCFFYLRLNGRLNKQSRGWRFETSSLSLWRHCSASSWHKFTFRQHYAIGPSVAFLNGRNSHRSCEPIITCDTRKFQHIFRPINHKMVISANWIPHWQSHCHTTTVY